MPDPVLSKRWASPAPDPADKILPSFLQPARPLTQRVISRPRIRGRETFANILAFTLTVA
jgi:hypothetical protein